jgi:uncharacterized membrane protein YebE (DUF533 family)
MYKQAIAIAVACVIAGQVLAGTPVLNARQNNQQARIAQGVRSGELTRPETARLAHGQVRLQRMENRVKSDGVVTAGERARLQHRANVQSRRIYAQKHDAQDRN